MATTLYLDGIDATTLGIYIQPMATEGWLDANDVGFEQASLPGQPGGVLSRYGTETPRQLKLPVVVSPATYSAANRELAERDLKTFKGRDIRVQLDDGSASREIIARLVRVKLRPGSYPTPQRSTGELHLVSEEGSWRLTTGVTLALSTTQRTLTLGNARVADWAIELCNSGGTVTDPTITIRNAAGATLHTLFYDGDITTTQYARWDARDGYIRLYSGGSYTSIASLCTGGLPTLDPWDGLTVQLSAASGTPTGFLTAPMRVE